MLNPLHVYLYFIFNIQNSKRRVAPKGWGASKKFPESTKKYLIVMQIKIHTFTFLMHFKKYYTYQTELKKYYYLILIWYECGTQYLCVLGIGWKPLYSISFVQYYERVSEVQSNTINAIIKPHHKHHPLSSNIHTLLSQLVYASSVHCRFITWNVYVVTFVFAKIIIDSLITLSKSHL